MTVAVETMREAHKADYTAATQYITACMAQINSANVNAPGTNPRRVSEVSSTDLARNEFNGVDICDPWRKFTDDEWFNKLGQHGQELVRAKGVIHATPKVEYFVENENKPLTSNRVTPGRCLCGNRYIFHW